LTASIANTRAGLPDYISKEGIMEEKSIWMLLFFGLLGFCILITVLLILNAGGVESKKKYNDLKGKYVDLANKQMNTLKTALEMKAGNTSANANGAGKGVPELTKQVEQLQNQVKEQGEKIGQWQGAFLGEYKKDGQIKEEEIREEIVRLKSEAAEYSKKEK
jgi:uncharacterized protein HemX